MIVTAVSPSTNGYFEIYPAGFTRPNTSTVSFRANRTRANNTVMALGTNGEIAVVTSIGGGNAHLSIDVVGYFE
ncbi:MAG: hypothetical protein ACTHQM_26730, partial [Thermoanaerobaculia bacterium]